MPENGHKLAMIGAGAIGGVTAALLASAGYDLEIVCKHRHLAETIRRRGLTIKGKKGDHQIRLNAVAAMADLSEPQDLVFLATKAADCVPAARELLPKLKPDAAVVSLQNGICEPDLAAVLGKERVIGCVVGWGASNHGQGVLEVTSAGGGKLDYYTFLAGKGALSEIKRHLVIRMIGHKYRRIKSSSLQSLERGRRTEVDFLNGYICENGRAHQVPTPVNDAVRQMVKEIENKQRKMGMANFKSLPGAF